MTLWIFLLAACSGASDSPYAETVAGLSGTMTADRLASQSPQIIQDETTSTFETGLPSTLTLGPSPTATPRPAASIPPDPDAQLTPSHLLGARGLLAFSLRQNGGERIWLWPLGTAAPFPVTGGDSENQDPAFSPDGSRLAFASHRDGNWELYILELATGQVNRLTNSLDFEGHPSWSVDSEFIAYEHYANGKFQICILPSTGGTPIWCSPDTLDAYEPSWYPRERTIVFTGRMGAQTEIFALNLDTLDLQNLTGTPAVSEHRPALSPDGVSVAYSAQKDGYAWTYTLEVKSNAKAMLTGQGDWPVWDPNNQWMAGVYYPDQQDSFLLFSPIGKSVLSPAALQLPGRVEGLDWSPAVLPNPLPAWMEAYIASGREATPTEAGGGTPLSASLTQIDVRAPDPRISNRVTARFAGLRAAVSKATGWDFLATLDSAVVTLGTPLSPGQQLSWLYTGRAISVSRGRTAQGFLTVVPDPLGAQEYWRLFVRAARQDGTLGEPLRDLPWNFDARMSGNPDAFNRGGLSYAAVPDGYFVDFTEMAYDYGWERFASDSNWRSFFPSIRYWEFACKDGLDWFQAMGEIYPFEKFLTPTPTDTPTPRPTWRWGPRPTDTRWPTPTFQIP